MNSGLAYIGKIIKLEPIKDADFILSATVICGAGGKWQGVVRKRDFSLNDLGVVYLPDALISPRDDMKFLEKNGWRVKMQRFKGVRSEVVIMPLVNVSLLNFLGEDVTDLFGVEKYTKPVPLNMQGIAKGQFPGFIPKTDEPNWQTVPELIDKLHGKQYYISQKCDGSSTTAYKRYGQFGICSRNWELEKDENNGYWKIAIKYDLENKLPEGVAIQWETCGPKVQSNPMGLKELDGFVFSAYNIHKHCYLQYHELLALCKVIKMKMVNTLGVGKFDATKFTGGLEVDAWAKGKYENGKEHEGIVVRSQWNEEDGKPISFKVINIDYDNT
jgi:RNA ligase (TIGR02306 family)